MSYIDGVIHNHNSILIVPDTPSKVNKLIDGLKNKNSSGWDEITPSVLKSFKEYMVNPLTFLINSSIEEGIFPNCLKLGVVRPIHKKNSKEEIGN